MPEIERGCGFRKVGAIYLVGEGLSTSCDMLPMKLEPCQCCGFRPSFSRNFQKLNSEYVNQRATIHFASEACTCLQAKPTCPLCFPLKTDSFGLMFVSSKAYTPENFIKEAKMIGVSKRIPEIPKGIRLNETWILLAYSKYPFHPKTEFEETGLKAEPKLEPAVFYAFKPARIEMLIWKMDVRPKIIAYLEKKGITPIIIEEGSEGYEQHINKKGYPDWFEKLLTNPAFLGE